MKTKLKALALLFILTVSLSACNNEPNATIRDVEKEESQLTVTLFIDDPTESIKRFDVMLMDEDTVLVSATNKKEADSIEGVWDITLPMTDITNGSYEIVVEATLSSDDTIKLATEIIEWP
ncbi:MAG: hypothetical protein ACOC1L_05665 [Bacillota bacterium]